SVFHSPSEPLAFQVVLAKSCWPSRAGQVVLAKSCWKIILQSPHKHKRGEAGFPPRLWNSQLVFNLTLLVIRPSRFFFQLQVPSRLDLDAIGECTEVVTSFLDCVIGRDLEKHGVRFSAADIGHPIG